MTKVLAFGAFDGLHKGHLWFLRQAGKCGEELIAVVARDSVVRRLKGRAPRKSESERVEDLKRKNLADEVVLGDEEERTWSVVEKFRPDVIAVGYDQNELREALEESAGRFDWNLTIKIMKPLESGLLDDEGMQRTGTR